MFTEETALLDKLRNTCLKSPGLEYDLVRIRDETSLTYGASFQTKEETRWNHFHLTAKRVKRNVMLKDLLLKLFFLICNSTLYQKSMNAAGKVSRAMT